MNNYEAIDTVANKINFDLVAKARLLAGWGWLSPDDLRATAYQLMSSALNQFYAKDRQQDYCCSTAGMTAIYSPRRRTISLVFELEGHSINLDTGVEDPHGAHSVEVPVLTQQSS